MVLGLLNYGLIYVQALGPIHYVGPELNHTLCPMLQFILGEPIICEHQRSVLRVEIIGIEQWSPTLRLDRRQCVHRLALFNDVWSERPHPFFVTL